jgi:hypothetical protein
VPQGVVDLLELVQVDVGDRQQAAFALAESVLQLLLEGVPVADSRDRVVVGQPDDL